MEIENNKMIFSFFALLIPIIIHFLIKRKSKDISFPSIFFLKETIKKKSQKIKFSQFLLLFLRLLIVFFLCLAILKPTIKVPNKISSSFSVAGNYIIILDTSLSMQAGTGKNSFFENLKVKMLDFLDEIPQGSRLTLYTTSGGGSVLGHPFSLVTGKLIKSIQSEIECGYEDGNLLSVYKRAEQLLSKSPTKENAISVFSDFQSTSSKGFISYIKNTKLKYPTLLYLPDQNHDKPVSNVYIKGSKIPFISYLDKNHIPVELTLSASGNNKISGLISISINNVIKEESPFSCDPESEIIKTILTERLKEEDTIIEIKLSGDDFSYDNYHYIKFHGPPLINILSINRDESSSKNYITKALDPFRETGDFNKTPFKIDIETSIPENLSDYDLVVIPDPLIFSDLDIRSIEDYILNGGNAFLSFNNLGDIEKYNETLFTPWKKSGSILPARLEKIIKLSDTASQELHITDEGINYFNSQDNMKLFKYVNVKTLLKFKSKSKSISSIIQSKDKFPFAILKNHGNGKILMFLTSLSPSHTNFISEPVFVPFIHKAVDILTSGSRKKIHTKIGKRFYIKDKSPNLHIIDPLGKKCDLSFDGIGRRYFIPQIAGIHNTVKNALHMDKFAVNFPTAESALNYDGAEIQSFKNINNVFTAFNKKNSVSFLNKRRGSLALWRFLLWGILLLILIENYIINKLRP